MIEEFLPPIADAHLREVLLPRLLGKVFHVTMCPAARSIIADGAIKANGDGRYPFGYPQSSTSYFRKQGCVCLFDLRVASEERVNATLEKFYFLNPWHNRPVFFVLDPARLPSLISAEGVAPSAMCVPHTEVGHKGDLSLDLVRTVLWVRVLEGDGPEAGTWSHIVWMAGRDDRRRAEEAEC